MFNVDYGQVEFLTSYNHALALFWCLMWVKSRLGYKVSDVTDGDTVKVKRIFCDELKVRLAEIDAPEKKQPGGEAARAALVLMCPVGSYVKLQKKGKGVRGREIGWIFMGPVNLNSEMVRLGHAWQYTSYSRSKVMADAQNNAKKANRGLWAGKNPQPPWEWRSQRKG